jgi:PAS domain S-box-containing protein
MAFFVTTLGLLVFCGWAFKVPALTFIRPTLQSMKVNTALSFLCLGAGLWLAHNDERQRSRRILGLLVVIIAGLTLAEYAFHVNLGIDQLLFRDTRTPSLSAYPGRMAIATAICFLFLGSAVTSLGLKKTLTLQRTLVGACFAFSLVALCGYLYGVKPLYSITSYSTMGLHTATGFFAACIAYFLAWPNEGMVSVAESESSAGLLLRRLVPAIIIVPILIGWLGLVGQRANLYDTPFGIALLVLGNIACLSFLTLLIGHSMRSWEWERSYAERAIRESERRFRFVADTAPVLIWMSGRNKLCTYFNKPWLEFTGRSIVQECGNGWAEGVHPEDLQECLQTYEQSFDRQEKFRMEYRLQRHDGQYRWMLDIGVPRFDPDSSFAGYIGIAVDETDRKQAEQALGESEERLRLAVQAGRMFAYSWDASTDIIERSGESAEILGVNKDEAATGAAVSAMVHPDDKDRVETALAQLSVENPNLRITYRIIRPDETITWVERNSRAYFDQNEKVTRVVGMIVDVTERKLAEGVLSGVSRKLIEAQEQERNRIGRELHDDIGQQLTMLAIELGQLRDNPSEIQSRVQELLKRLVEISDDLQALSHELHSSKLGYLGVIPGIRNWCREFCERQKMEIDFRSDVSHPIPLEIGLCLYRVLQEALHNVIKHSGTKRVEVKVAQHANEIHLDVNDFGKGFDIEIAKQDRGLGLTSMQERVRLVGGAIVIDSKPLAGTTINVRVPLGAERRSQSAVG